MCIYSVFGPGKSLENNWYQGKSMNEYQKAGSSGCSVGEHYLLAGRDRVKAIQAASTEDQTAHSCNDIPFDQPQFNCLGLRSTISTRTPFKALQAHFACYLLISYTFGAFIDYHVGSRSLSCRLLVLRQRSAACIAIRPLAFERARERQSARS